MIHIKGEGTANPKVNWLTKTADCACDACGTERSDFPISAAAPFNGNAFVFMSNAFCSCQYTTVYPLNADDPTAKLLGRLSGLLTEQKGDMQ
jgi:hypothetical protein